MAYAGTMVPIYYTAEKKLPDNVTSPLSDTDVGGVQISIEQVATGTLVVPVTDMDWNDANSWWEYHWNTASPLLDPGSYIAKIMILGVGGGDDFDFKRIRLRKPLF